MAARIAIAGATGRMGQMLVRAVGSRSDLQLVSAIERAGHSRLGEDVGTIGGGEPLGVALSDDLAAACEGFDVLIDFTIAEATASNVDVCREAGKRMVIGTTGLSTGQESALRAAGEVIPIVFAPNYAIGVNVAFKLAEIAARILGDDVDIEITEAHHRHKVDAPSGTALGLGKAVAGALGRDLPEVAVFGREGITGERERAQIGFHSIRAGEIVGEHSVLFAAEGELLELTHRAQSRVNFAQGAVRAAAWLMDKNPGVYDMQDVLGLNRVSIGTD